MERLDQRPYVAGPEGLALSALRWIGALLSVACVAAALHEHAAVGRTERAWWLLAAALAASIVWTSALAFPRGEVEPTVTARRWLRIALGGPLFAAGALFFADATHRLYLDWMNHFDRTWLTWVGAAAVMAAGLDVASGPWRRLGTVRRWHLAVLLALVGMAALYRLGNIAEFPGEGTATQIEDLQTGQWGFWYQEGQGRMRWEYLSHAWLAGLGIWLGGPTMLAMRLPFAVISVLKTVPLFFWLLFAGGPAGAVVGTALYACSAWDVVLSRTPNNHNGLIVATVFALLAGPVRRGRPSAYVIIGLLSGYLLHEYVAYRPLVVLAVAGTTWVSLRDRAVAWPLRIARPLLTLALIIAMGVPLFLQRLSGDRLYDEYFNGWNRARAIQPYYNPDDTWRAALDKRIARSFDALALFYFSGDPHPSRRVGQPLVDPITGALLIVGVGCALARLRHPVFALTVAGLGITVAGTLIATGNFDVGRVGGAVPYVYACVGYGAAALALLARGRAAAVQALAAALLAAAVLAAAHRNTQVLVAYWESPVVRRALRSNLAFLSSWLRRHGREDEQVIAVAPGYHHVLEANDAAWLRGREASGIAAWDVESALRYWSDNPRKTLLVVFAGPGTAIVQRYLEWLIPGLQMQFEDDPLKLDGEIAYARLNELPARLHDGLKAMDCHGGEAVFRLVGRGGPETLLTVERRVPFIDSPVFPGELRSAIVRTGSAAGKVVAEFRTEFRVERPGIYRFVTQAYPGAAELSVDGQPHPTQYGRALHLEAGDHRLELAATLAPDPVAMVVRLFWSGPDSNGKQEIMPLYRLAPAHPKCAGARSLG